MSFQIGIEVDDSRIAWVQDSEKHNSVLTKLTTLTDNQTTAEIKFHIRTAKGKFHICTESINRIPPMRAGEPSIDVVTKISGKTLNYRISLNGRIVSEQSRPAGKYTKKSIPLIPILLLTAAAAAVAAVFFLFPGKTPDIKRVPEKNTVSVKTADSAVNPAEKPVSEKTQPDAVPDSTPDENAAAETEPAVEPETTDKTETVIPEKPVITWSESEIFDQHSVYFSPDSAILSSETISDLNAFISSLPEADDFEEGFFELAVRGHCAKYGTEEGRAELSRERASEVTAFLRTKWGIEADYMTSGAGASEPVTLKRDEQHLNRRVEIEIKGSIRNKITSE